MRKLIALSLICLSSFSQIESKQFFTNSSGLKSDFKIKHLNNCLKDSFYKIEDPLLNVLLKHAYHNNIDLLLLRDSFDCNNCLARDFISIQEERKEWQKLSKEIILNYLNLRVTQQKAVFLDKNIANQNQKIVLIKELLERGSSDSITLTNANAELNKLYALKIDLNLTQESLISTISNLLSVGPCCLLKTLKSANDLPRICSSPSSLTFNASLNKRPDIQKALWQLNKLNSCQNKLLYRQTYLTAFNEASNAYDLFQSNEMKSKFLNKAFYEYSESYNLVLDLHKRGLKDSFELIEANNQMIDAQISYIESRADILLSFVSLNHALGRSVDYCHR